MSDTLKTKHSRQAQTAAVGALLSLVILTGYGLHAQTTVPAKKTRSVAVSGKTYTEKPTPQGTIRTLLGDTDKRVIIKSEDTTLTTDKAIYNETTQVATSPGKLQLNDEYNTLTASTGTAFYKTRDAQFRGSVVVVARPRPQDKNAPEGSSRRQFDAPATITTEKLDYNWRTRICRILVPLTLKQKDRTVTADRGTYDARTEVASLEGNVHYTKPNGDTATFTSFRAVLKEGQEEFTGYPVKAVFTIEDEDEPATPATGTRPTPRPGNTPNNSPAPPTSTPPNGTENNNGDPGTVGRPNPQNGGTTSGGSANP